MAAESFDSEKNALRPKFILKISKMPVGCGCWPAAWTATTSQWPSGGEIDILEGVNAVSSSPTSNLASLHTTDGCTIPEGRYANSTGYSYQQNCAYQPGCSQKFSGGGNSFGYGFNANSGGYFAMLRDTAARGNGISVYFWPASASPNSIPISVRAAPGAAPRRVITSPFDLAEGGNKSATINKLPDKTYEWGLPSAFFPNTAPGANFEGAQCQMDQFFNQDHTIILNLSLCGVWAGQVWSQTPECAALAPTCDEFVRNNPRAFIDAVFEVDYIRVYGSSQSSQGAGSVILGRGAASGRPGWVVLVGAVVGVTCLVGGSGFWGF